MSAENKKESFIKSVKQTNSLTKQQKVMLNRKANELFNSGDFKKAEQIFLATGYSDGLRRMGDYYRERKEPEKALQMYCISGQSRLGEDLIESAAAVITNLLREGD